MGERGWGAKVVVAAALVVLSVACGGGNPDAVDPELPAQEPSGEPDVVGVVPEAPTTPPEVPGVAQPEPEPPVDEPDAGFTPNTPPSGSILWSKELGANLEDQGVASAVSPLGNVFVASRFSNGTDFGGGPVSAPEGTFGSAVTKFSPSGRHVWTRAFTSSHRYVQAYDIAVDSSGSTAMVGDHSQGADFGTGPVARDGAFIVKLRHDGERLWTRVISGNESSATFLKGAFDALGNLYVAGTYSGAGLDFGDGVSRSSDDLAGVVVKYSPSGQVLWVRSFTAEGASLVSAFATDPAGRIVVGVAFSGSMYVGGSEILNGGPPESYASTPALVAYDADGTYRWSRMLSTRLEDLAFNGGLVAAVGSFVEPFQFGATTFPTGGQEGDGFLAVWDANGMEKWWHRFGGIAFEGLSGVAMTSAGEIWVSGMKSEETSSFAGRSLTGAGLMVARLAAGGEVRWVRQSSGTPMSSGGLSVNSNGESAVAHIESVWPQGCNDAGRSPDFQIGLLKVAP